MNYYSFVDIGTPAVYVRWKLVQMKYEYTGIYLHPVQGA